MTQTSMTQDALARPGASADPRLAAAPRRRLLGASLGATLLAGLGAGGARAQGIEQVKILYGFPPGSAGDTVARRVGEKLAGSAYTRAAGVVENKPGAGGRIALDLAKIAPADGSTLVLTPFSCTSIYPHIYSKLSYDPVRDFTPVSIAAIMHHGLAIGPLVPASVKTVKEFLAWAKANPNQASYGSPAAGSTPHFIGALLGMNNGVDMKHVPYRGSVPGVTDVVGGQLAAMVTPSGDFIPNHRAGKLRLIATSGAARSPFTPEVATFAEQGFPELTTEEWFDRGVVRFLCTCPHAGGHGSRGQCGHQCRPEGQGRDRQPGDCRAAGQRLDARRDGAFAARRIRALGSAGQADRIHGRVLSDGRGAPKSAGP